MLCCFLRVDFALVWFLEKTGTIFLTLINILLIWMGTVSGLCEVGTESFMSSYNLDAFELLSSASYWKQCCYHHFSSFTSESSTLLATYLHKKGERALPGNFHCRQVFCFPLKNMMFLIYRVQIWGKDKYIGIISFPELKMYNSSLFYRLKCVKTKTLISYGAVVRLLLKSQNKTSFYFRIQAYTSYIWVKINECSKTNVVKEVGE
jgi:hypothetical protein